MLDKRRIRHKGLRRFVQKGDSSGLNQDWIKRIARVVYALDVAVSPYELDIPGNDFHELKGDRAGTYALKVSGNWRLTFEWGSEGPRNVDLEDYHGR